jgi:alanine racemase
MDNPVRFPWAEISLTALQKNFKTLQKKANNSKILPVVKANAYGHGLIPISKALVQFGAQMLAVAYVQEGIQLRKNGIQCPILVLTPTLNFEIPDLLEYNLIPQISSLQGALEISKIARRFKAKPIIHLKIDTGMRRVGFSIRNWKTDLNQLFQLPNIQIRGIYTHLATADMDNKKYTYKQIDDFYHLIEQIRKNFNRNLEIHIANSAAILFHYSQVGGDWVRPGLSLYGVYPRMELLETNLLDPVMCLKTRVIHLKTILKNESVSYGRTFLAKKRTRVATIGIGYADGLLRSLSNRGTCLIHGKMAPIIGTICMDMTMVDISKISKVQIGDEVVLFGRGKNAYLPVEHQAKAAGTIAYELLCAIGERVSRFYYEG